jgi:hypothetical protein
MNNKKEKEIKMFKNKPVTLVIASALMIVLIIAVGVFQFAGINRGFGGGPGGRFQPGNMPQNGNLPQGGFTGNGGFQQGSGPTDGSNSQGFSGRNFSGNGMAMRLMQLVRGVQISASVLVMALGILSVVGMLLLKKWGRVLAIIASVLIFISAIPGLFQRMFGLTMIGTLIKIALAIAIFVLCLLPKSRQTAPVTSPAPTA